MCLILRKIQAAITVMISVVTNAAPIPFVPIPSICFQIEIPIKVAGRTVDTVRIIYKGRVLTPVRFGMTPKTPRASYTLKTEITKGGKKTLGKVKKLTKKQRQNIGRNFTRQGQRSSNKSPVMLMSTGNAHAGGTNFIPFQRVSHRRNDLKAIKTLSVPQMVSNPQVEKNIYSKISKELGKRFEHYTERYFK